MSGTDAMRLGNEKQPGPSLMCVAARSVTHFSHARMHTCSLLLRIRSPFAASNHHPAGRATPHAEHGISRAATPAE